MPAKTYLEQPETVKLEEQATCLRDKVLIHIVRRLGCRISEALGLAVEDIDFDAGNLVIQHLKVRTKLTCPLCGTRLGKKTKFCPECASKVAELVREDSEHRRVRTIPSDPGTLALIREYIDRGGPTELVMPDGTVRHMLFNIGRKRAWQLFVQCADRAGLPTMVNPETGKKHHVSPHKLRDAFAINAVKKNGTGDGIRLLQEHLGHKNINTTMGYRKVAGEESAEWYRGLFEEDK